MMRPRHSGEGGGGAESQGARDSRIMPRERAREILQWIVDSSPADQTEAGLIDTRSYLTRFTRNAVHQNVGTRDTSLWIRVLDAGRLGTTSTNLQTADGAERALKQALEIARHQKPLEVSFDLPAPEHMRPVDTWAAETAQCTPLRRAEMLQPVFEEASGRGVDLAGALRTEEVAMAVANDRGIDAWQAFTSADANLLASAGEALGYAYGRQRAVGELDLSGLAGRAMDKALRGAEPRDLAPGRYDVVLEPAAVATLFTWLGFIAFGARSVEEGTSFLAGREGEQVLHESVTIYDDGLEDPETATPFDFEGVPRSRVMLVNKGMARAPVLDSRYAARMGRTSTGHATGPGGDPLPVALFLEAGEQGREDLISGIERGLLVTRFHYVNGLLEPRKARMTGMTKDGTFLIEGGEVVAPIENLRFTESITEAFGRVLGLSAERERHASWLTWTGGITVPHVAIEDFRFTGKA